MSRRRKTRKVRERRAERYVRRVGAVRLRGPRPLRGLYQTATAHRASARRFRALTRKVQRLLDSMTEPGNGPF